MFRYGLLLKKKPLGYVQYNLLRNRSKRPVNELKQAIIQRDILEIWESESAEEGSQSYLLLIGHDLKIWHDAGIHFQIVRRRCHSDWREVADFSTPHADGLNDWQQESDRVLQVEGAVQKMLSGRHDPGDVMLMSAVIDAPLPDDPETLARLLSEVFPFQSVDERHKLAARLQDETLRRLFINSAESVDGRSGGHSDKAEAGNNRRSGTKRGIWPGFLRLFRRSG